MLNSIDPTSSLVTAQTNLLTAMQQMSSGSSINSAADNPAGMAQSVSYSVQLSGTAQMMNNIQNNLSMLDTAGGGLSQVTQNLQDMRSLAVQAGNASLSPSDLQSLQDQFNQLAQGIDQVAGGTQFNGQNLLNGSFNQVLQAGNSQVALGNSSSGALAVSGLDITTSIGQANALAAIDNAIQQTSTQQGSIGAVQAGLSSDLANLGNTYQNLSAANSQVSDTDYAKASTDLAQAKVQQQVALKVQAMYNSMQGNVLNLLPGSTNSGNQQVP
jgi:flagellin